MDYRDTMFWVREARLKSLRDDIKSLHQMRIAQLAGQEDFERICGQMEQRLRLMEAGKSEREIEQLKVRQSWDDLKALSGGA